MGGKNAIIVLEDAHIALAVEGVLWGAFGTSGQRCTATSRVILHEKIYDEFAKMLVSKLKDFKVGNGSDESIQMGPQVNAKQRKTTEKYVEIGAQEGAKLLTGGKILNSDGHSHGHFHQPTVFGECTPQMRISQEEIFGPVTSLIRCKDFDDAIRIANSVQYGLSSAIYTRDVNRAFRAIRDLDAGITYVNAPTIGAEVHLPFGGVKQTGNGHREGGIGAIDFYTQWKAVYIDYSDRLQRAQIDKE
jgi:aldehyde dehydrogenase (NAD+)